MHAQKYVELRRNGANLTLTGEMMTFDSIFSKLEKRPTWAPPVGHKFNKILFLDIFVYFPC